MTPQEYCQKRDALLKTIKDLNAELYTLERDYIEESPYKIGTVVYDTELKKTFKVAACRVNDKGKVVVTTLYAQKKDGGWATTHTRNYAPEEELQIVK